VAKTVSEAEGWGWGWGNNKEGAYALSDETALVDCSICHFVTSRYVHSTVCTRKPV
jgi:hypothetical protein